MLYTLKYLVHFCILISFIIAHGDENYIKININSIEDLKILSRMDVNLDHHRSLDEVNAYASDEKIIELEWNYLIF